MKRLVLFTLAMICCLLSAHAQQYQSVDNEEFAKIVKQKKTQLIDVRTAQEYESGHIAGALNMDILKPEFEAQASQLKKKHPVALYCRSGKRSKKAAEKLSSMGYKVYELNTGIAKWPGKTEK